MFLFRLSVIAVFLITTLFTLVPAFPVSAQTGHTTTDTATLLQNADHFFAEKSYALASESYGKYLLAVPSDGEVRYRYAVSLIRSQSWNQALATTNALYTNKTLSPILRARVMALRGELYRLLPDVRWRVGEEIYWGYERPVVAPAKGQPVQESVGRENETFTVDSYEEAAAFIGQLTSGDKATLHSTEVEIYQELTRSLQALFMRWAYDKTPSPIDVDWTINTKNPYPQAAPIAKRLFYVLTRYMEITEVSPDDHILAVRERVNILSSIREWTIIRSPIQGFPQRVETSKIKSLPYAKEDPIALMVATARRFPQTKGAGELFLRAANDAGMSERGKNLFAELLRLFPQFRNNPSVQEQIKLLEAQYLRLGSTAAIAPGTKPVTVSHSVKNLDTIRYTLYKLDERKTLLDSRVWSKPGTSPGNIVANIGGWAYIKNVGVPVKSWQVSVKRDARYPYKPVQGRATVPVPRDRAGKSVRGLYLLTATAGNDRYRAASLIPITDLALVRKSIGNDTCMLYVANAETGTPIPGAKLSLKWTRIALSKDEKINRIRYATRLDKGETDQDGIHIVPVPTLPGDSPIGLQVVAQVGTNQFAVLMDSLGKGHGGDQWYDRSTPSRRKLASVADSATYCYTERPLYRASQTVQYRVIRAKATGAASYRPQVGETLTVRVRSDNGHKEIYQGTVTTSVFGTAHGSFVLPDGASLGRYVLQASPVAEPVKEDDGDGPGGDISEAHFYIEEYRRPEFTVKLDAQTAARDGDTIVAAVKATRFDGSPLSNATVNVKIERDYRSESETRTPETVREEKVSTDERGEARITFPVSEAKKENGKSTSGNLTNRARESNLTGTAYRVTVRATDAAGREQSNTISIPLLKEWYTATLSAPSNFVAAGETAKLRLAIQDGSNTPGAAIRGKFVVQRLRFEKTSKTQQRRTRRGYDDFAVETGDTRAVYRADTNSSVIHRSEVQTGAGGEAPITFPTTVAGRYQVIFTGIGKQGESITAQTIVLVGGGGDSSDGSEAVWQEGTPEQSQFLPQIGVRIVPERNGAYADGETARFLIICEKPNTPVVLCIETNKGLLSRQLVTISGYSKVVSLPVRGMSYAPNVAVSVMGVRGGDTVSALCNLPVPAVWNLARVSVAMDKEIYKPGETGTFRVRATDASGKPVRAEVSLGAIDASLLALQSNEDAEIGDFFYTNRERAILVSLRGFEESRFLPYVEYFDANLNKYALEPENIPRLPQQNAAGGYDRRFFAGARLRSDFRETGVWFPAIVTDATTGEAVVTATFPDSLTAWKVTAQGVTEQVLVGVANNDFVTRKNLAVRLSTPRFLVERDTATFTVSVRNDLTEAKTVRIRLEGEGMVRGMGEKGTFPTQSLTVPANAEGVAQFAASVPIGTGTQTLRAYAETDEESDAVQATLPVLPYGVQKFETQAGSLNGTGDGVATMKLVLPAERKQDSSALLVQIAPGPMGAILDALPYLADYPYGCAEQTMNRFLPSVLVAKTLAKTGVPLETIRKRADLLRKQNATNSGFGQTVSDTSDTTGYTYPAGTPNLLQLKTPNLSEELSHGDRWRNPVFDESLLAKMTREGSARLLTFRKPDGGFGWWAESQKSDPYMTAYILYGFAEMKSIGMDVDDDNDDIGRVLRAGGKYLERELNSNPETHESIWLLHALTYCNKTLPVPTRNVLNDVYDKRDTLSPYGLSLLALTLYRAGDAAKASIVCRNLQNFIVVDARSNTAEVRWDGGRPWEWYANRGEATAWALRALLAVEPDSKLLAPLAEGLVQSRRGGYWRSTKETAFIVYALTEYFSRSGQVAPDMTVTVALNNTVKREYRITPENAFLFDNQFVVPGSLLKSGNQTVTITKKGTGRLDYAGALQFVTTEKKIQSAGSEIAVHRRYKRANGMSLNDGDTMKSGDRITVELTVTAQNDYRYVLLEDRKPAGCEPTNIRSGFAWGNDLWATCEVRDTKTAFFVEYLSRGTYTLTYELRAEPPGTFHALPANALAMYSPEVRAISDSAIVTLSP